MEFKKQSGDLVIFTTIIDYINCQLYPVTPPSTPRRILKFSKMLSVQKKRIAANGILHLKKELQNTDEIRVAIDRLKRGADPIINYYLKSIM